MNKTRVEEIKEERTFKRRKSMNFGQTTAKIPVPSSLGLPSTEGLQKVRKSIFALAVNTIESQNASPQAGNSRRTSIRNNIEKLKL